MKTPLQVRDDSRQNDNRYPSLFIELLADIHDGLNQPFAPPPIPPGDAISLPIRHGEIDVTLSYEADRLRDGMAVVVHFGRPPESPAAGAGNAHPAYRRVLEMNALLFAQRAGMFSLRPDTGELVYSFEVPLEQVEAMSLLAALSLLAEQAQTWRMDAFAGTPMVATLPWLRA